MVTADTKSPPIVEPPLIELPTGRLTAEQFLDWIQEKMRADLLDGIVHMHSPVSLKHAFMVNFVSDLLAAFARRRKLGHVFREQIAVRLSNDDVVMPDLLFVALEDVKRLEPNVVPFAPSLVVEVLSPSSITRDTVDKLATYEELGVSEYWILDPARFRHLIYQRAGKLLRPVRSEDDILVRSSSVQGFYLRRSWLNQPEFPMVEDSLEEILASLG